MNDSSGAGRERLTLGIDQFLDRFLESSPDLEELIAKDQPADWRFLFLEAMDDPMTEVFFNLRALTSRPGSSGPRPGEAPSRIGNS